MHCRTARAFLGCLDSALACVNGFPSYMTGMCSKMRTILHRILTVCRNCIPSSRPDIPKRRVYRKPFTDPLQRAFHQSIMSTNWSPRKRPDPTSGCVKSYRSCITTTNRGMQVKLHNSFVTAYSLSSQHTLQYQFPIWKNPMVTRPSYHAEWASSRLRRLNV